MMIKTQHQALYQTGKVAAESGLDLEYGKRNLYNYLDLKVAAKEIPEIEYVLD